MDNEKNINLLEATILFFCLLFTGLKLTGYIDWSWYWVLSPVLIPILIAVLGILLILVLTLAAKLKYDQSKRR